jgi:hypothetical protein
MEDPEELTKKAEKRRKATARRQQKEAELRTTGELPPEPEEDDDAERRARGGENTREISWIWTEAGVTGTDLELEDGKYLLELYIGIMANRMYSSTYRMGKILCPNASVR